MANRAPNQPAAPTPNPAPAAKDKSSPLFTNPDQTALPEKSGTDSATPDYNQPMSLIPETPAPVEKPSGTTHGNTDDDD